MLRKKRMRASVEEKPTSMYSRKRTLGDWLQGESGAGPGAGALYRGG